MDLKQFYPENVFRFCPRCGHPDFKKFTDYAFKCATCDFVLYVNESTAVIALIINDKNEVLLTIRKNEPCKGGLDLPGGFVNVHEKAEDAIIREVKEELNLDVTELNYLCTSTNQYFYKGLTYFTLDIAYVAKIRNLNEVKPNDDVADFLFVPVNEFDADRLVFSSTRDIFKIFQSKK